MPTDESEAWVDIIAFEADFLIEEIFMKEIDDERIIGSLKPEEEKALIHKGLRRTYFIKPEERLMELLYEFYLVEVKAYQVKKEDEGCIVSMSIPTVRWINKPPTPPWN